MVAAKKLSPLLVIVGETASGKTALSLELAEHFNGEIICADSLGRMKTSRPRSLNGWPTKLSRISPKGASCPL